MKLIIFIIILFSFIAMNTLFSISPILILPILIISIVLIVIVIGLYSNDNNSKRKNIQTQTYHNEKHYEKKCLMTLTEKQFYKAIKKFIPENYILLPQVNLATIIQRVEEHTYQNELYRNIDFVLFNNDYIPLLLIEINDDTHNDPQRRERDKKVKEICQSAQIPIISFWTEYGINEEYIKNTIHKYI